MQPNKQANLAHKLRISTGSRSLGKVTNRQTTWGKLIERMSDAQEDKQHTLAQYLQLSKDRQFELKNVGFFVGGHCDGGIRKLHTVHERWVVALDVDEPQSDVLTEIEWGETELAGYEFFVYSTRKHSAEKPRLRVILPLAVAVEAEAYFALSRILASQLDPSMESVDPVSFRVSQVMFWPSVCKDAEFYTFHNPGKLAVPAEILEEFGDWKDHTKLPRSERDESQYTAPGVKPVDPTTKEGLVGAFCRVYDVNEAIAEYLSDIYVDPIETAQGTRYTYANGTTHHGAIVYDDGRFLFSNHMHDPAAGHSQNAFDLVRIHLHGELDKKTAENTSPMRMPSVKAMLATLEKDKDFRAEMVDNKYDFDAILGRDVSDNGAFEDLGDDTSDPLEEDDLDRRKPAKSTKSTVKGKNPNWIEEMDMTSEGVIKPSLPNLVAIICNDPRLEGACRLNLFDSKVVYFRKIDMHGLSIDSPPVIDKVNGSLWDDAHTAALRFLLESPRGEGRVGYGMRVSDRDLEAAIDVAAAQQAFHPVKDYLDWLVWDGKPRVDKLFVEYLGADDNPYHRLIARLTMVAAVMRIYEPGSKWDYVPILEGEQGLRKSTFIEVLAHNWARLMKASFDDVNRTVENMNGAWILEVPELTQFRKSDINRIKDFFSTKSETTRLAFAKRAREFRRQCIFMASVNPPYDYLRDPSGNRRMWPVRCKVDSINLDKLKRNLDQLWAEAVTIYTAMRAEQPYGDLPLFIADEEIAKDAVDQQEMRRTISQEESMAQEIENWLDTPCTEDDANGKLETDGGEFSLGPKVYRHRTCTKEIWQKLFNGDPLEVDRQRGVQLLLSAAMSYVRGWEKAGRGYHGVYGQQRVYTRLVELDPPKQEIDDEL